MVEWSIGLGTKFCRRHFGHCQTNHERNRFGKFDEIRYVFEVGGVMQVCELTHKSHGAAPFYYRTEFTTLPRYCEEAWFLFKHRCTCFAICKPGKSVSRAARLHEILLCSSPNCEVSVWLCTGWHGSVGHHCGTYYALRGSRQLLIWETLKLRDPIFLILYLRCFEIHGLTCLTD